MDTKKLDTRRVRHAFEKNIAKHAKIKTQDNKTYEGYIEKVESDHVSLAIPKTKRAGTLVKSNENWFRRRHFRRVVLPLSSINLRESSLLK
ncbi:hypothetical protein [Aneurinibacillus aneurinilyticus]|uniref:Uncharacterized protein n=2 Tax=Aneurinibacillus aneurinilyticus TaxID=1391 RepID=A0A848CTG5_ANEAE|nr:hypothetical protein [Aneurinibacillus aneurinilyticus]ERI09113.1 hypothetical protein HMPREF0083_02798 [Aneurinibacillus aneurinilyticus ATCC 12856]MED0669627.1 hypothetical protein [Aneurinibacillus aneurinilyticus]MED0709346.1 hypothetical protein [Aneurinibacillus aneurinilyticus]MED0723959.1 hypothetical protein [Aneurinibacillus aneurinilyticus]MED0735068.1 hypothetical protein [Aneurinibacillus aneurinilyticus]